MTGINSSSKVWLITGCSSGLGLYIAEAALARGDQVIATAREPKKLAALEERFSERARTCRVDVNEPDTVQGAVTLAEEAFGKIDVLVNNAGYGIMGAIEEATAEEYRPIFETNVFGLIEVTKAVLPILRKQRSGRIVNLSSGAGIAGAAGYGYYNATKFAVEGLSEALAKEVTPLGVRVIIVEPGQFRTDFLGRSILMAKNEIPDYSQTSGTLRDYRRRNDGQQTGDPAKAAAVILKAVDSDQPPLHLPLGPAAHAVAERKLASFREDIQQWREISIATNFD